jgi:hypothetical protein
MTNLYSSWGSCLKMRQILSTILFTFSLCCFSVMASAQSYAGSIAGENGINNSSYALGAADGSGAQFYENGDVLTLQLDATVPAGSPYYITWRKRTGEAGNARPVVRESVNGGSYTENGSLTQSSSTSFVTIAYTAGCDINYIQITKNSSVPADFEIDAITTLQYDDCAATIGGCTMIGYEGNGTRVLWIPAFGTDFKPSGSIGLSLTKYADGSAHMSGIVERISDSSKKFVVKLWFKNGSDYSSWISQGNIAHSPELGDEANWYFFDFDMSKSNQLLGLEGQESTRLNLFPQVSSGSADMNNLNSLTQSSLSGSNFQYGYQLGQGANALNSNFGSSAWFVYNGTASGSGDINSNLTDCWDNNVCNNVTNGGTIGSNQTGVAPFDPVAITSISLPSGGTGTTEYMWLYANATTGWNLVQIDGADQSSYDPGSICETTTYRRCAKKVNCSSWDGESNDVTITVSGNCNTCNNVTSGGTIGSDQNGCSPFDPAAITNVAWPTGGSGNIEYMWLYKNASTSWNLVEIVGANAASYDPGALTETTTFRRCARRENCTSWNGESNDVTITVNACCDNITNGGEIGYDQAGCAPYDPTAFVSINLPSGGSGTIEYLWMFKNASTGWNFWTISGANGPTYDAGPLSETTYFRRCARRSGCNTWDGESNDVIITIITDNIAPTFTNVPSDATVECAAGIPAVVTPTVTDNIDTNPTITFSSDTIVNGMSSYMCEVTDADSHTLYISGEVLSALGLTNPNFSSVTPGQFELFADGSLKMTGIVQSVQNTDKKFEYTAWFKSQRSYDEWHSIPNSNTASGFREAKLEAGTSVNITNEYLDWSYFEQDASKPNTLVGLGSLAGTNLTMSHYPLDYQFGGQLGDKASLQSPGQGFSAWIWIEGSCNGNDVASQGDFNVDLNGCQEITTTISSQNCEITDADGHTLWVSTEVASALGISNPNFTSVSPGVFETFPDGSLKMTGIVQSVQQPSKKFEYTAWFKSERTWNEWHSIPNSNTASGFREAKIDAGTSVSITNEYLDWTYYEQDASKPNILVGLEDLEGVNLTISHFPLDYQFGGQLGDKGSLQSTGYGFSAWIWIEGSCNGVDIAAQGDFNVDLNNCEETTTELDCSSEYQIIRRWTAADDCGNQSTATQTITVIGDTEAPVLTNLPSEYPVACGQLPTADDFNVSATDNCDNDVTVTVSYVDNGSTEGCNYSRTFTWVATDDCGNMTSESRTFQTQDNEEPTFDNLPENQSVACGTLPTIESLNVTASDNCDEAVVVTGSFSDSGSGCNYTRTFTWVATDDCGNEITATRTFTIYDNVDPVFTQVPSGTSVDCGMVPDPSNFVVMATDNCDGDVEITSSYVDAGTGCNMTRTITWTATDDCGNDVSVTVVFTIADSSAPVLVNVPANTSVECGTDIASLMLEAIDNCDQDVYVTVEANTEANPNGCGYIFTRTWTATDDCGNQSTAIQTISIIDTTSPTIVTEAQDATYTCEEVIPMQEPTFADVCDASLNVTFNTYNVSSGCTYDVVREWTATDDCGNSVVATQVLHIIDETAPVLYNVPAEETVSCDNISTPSTSVYAVDACDTDVNVVYSETTNMFACGYDIIRTWTATDDCGNSASASQIVHVVDNTNPMIFGVPADAVVSCDNVPAPATSVYATDNCDSSVNVVFAETTENGPVLDGVNACGYTIYRRWVATDDCGNQSEALQVIMVQDLVAPVLQNIPANTTAECGNIPAAPTNIYATDNCFTGNMNIVLSENMVPMNACTYQLVRTWTVADNCLNYASAQQVITITDNTAPVFVDAPANTTVSCNEVPALINIEATDACDQDVTVDSFEMVGTGCPYVITRTWVATDECGNVAVHTQMITVVDETAPYVVSAPEDVTVECNTPLPTDMPVFGDNCDTQVDVTAISGIANQSDCGYDVQKSWTATDNCGNQTTVSQTIHVLDTTAPVFESVPADATVSCDAIPAVVMATATDNCSTATVTISETATEGCPYTITRTFTATDLCGNASTATQVLTVIDEVNPVIHNVPMGITVECGDEIGSALGVYATDNCDNNVTLTFVEEAGSGFCTHYVVRTWTAVDNCGNTTTATQTITLVDTTDPTLVGVPANVTVECNAIPAVANVSATDNCSEDLSVGFIETTMDQECGYLLIRTWTVHDDCNNTTSATQVITVTDTTAPSATYVPSSINVECDAQVPYVAATFGDICDENVSVSYSDVEVANGCSYDIVRTWTATDDCGNTATAEQMIHIVDTTAPVFVSVPADMTVECDNVPAFEEASATDNCSDVTITYSETSEPAEIMMEMPCGEIITRTWTATDECGNVATATQVVTIVDTTAPELVGVPANVTVECDEIPAPPVVSAVDNCDTFPMEVVMTENILPGDGCSYTIVRTWTVEDNCWNYNSASQLITVIDTTAPVLSGEDSELTLECNMMPSVVAPIATDNCDENVEVVFSSTSTPGACENSWTEVYTWIATDNCGNSAQRHMTFHFEDTTAPYFTSVQENQTVECSSVPAPFNVLAADNCDDNVAVSFSEEMTSGCPYTITRTWVAEDNCGNTAEYVQTLTVVDTTYPVLVNLPSDVTIECTDMLPVAFVTATDNCDEEMNVTMTSETVEMECGHQVIRTWSVTDDCGNTSTASQTVTVTDTTAPYIVSSPAASVTIECDEAEPTDAPVFGDACDTELSIFAISGINNVSDCGYDIEKSWTATDDCGNSVSFSRVIHVVDTTAPVFTSTAADVTVECSNIPAAAEMTATDNCSEVTIAVSDMVTNLTDCTYTIERTWTATDACGNASTYNQELSVVDTTAPVFVNVPANETVSCDAVPAAPYVIATDNCDAQVAVSLNEETSGTCPYTITRIWTAVDNCGNTTVATQVVTVVDEIAPVLFNVPADVTIECTETVAEANVIATDNCTEIIIVSLDAVTEESECGAIMTRTWTAEDACGNTTVAVQVVTIVDTQAPYIVSAPTAELTVECSDEVPYVAPEFGDACDEEVEVSYISGFNNISACGYDIERVWTAADNCGNEVSVSQVIHVVDTTAPVFTSVAEDMTVNCDQIPAAADMTASDNCSGVNITMNEQMSEGCPYTITRTWTAMDECGNSTNYVQVLTVIDEVAPVIMNVPMGITVECGDEAAAAEGVYAIDNCDSDVELTYSEVPGSGFCTHYMVRTWTAVDNCGNTTTATQTITYIDTTAPVFEGEDSELTLECNMQASIVAPIATDVCDTEVDVTMEMTSTPGVCENNWTEVYTWTATDDCGNTAVRTMTINYVDTTAPTFDFVPANATVECDAVPAVEMAIATDNCDDEVTVSVEETSTEGCPYTITRTFTAVDNCGNMSQASQVLTVVDTTNPVLVGVPSDVTILCTDSLPAYEVSAYDNCDLNVLVTMSQSTEYFSCGHAVTRTWTATDACGNVSTGTQVVNVIDVYAPGVTSQPEADITISCDQEVPFEAPVFDDFCSGVANVDYNEEIIGELSCSYDIVRTWVAYDYCQNATEVVVTIHVIDNVDPVLVNVPADAVVECDAVPAPADVTATDNCADDLNVSMTENEIAQDCGYLLVRTWTAHDECGNTTSATQVLTVVDTTAPELTGEDEVLNLECNIQASIIAPTAMDNCDADVTITAGYEVIEGACENSWTEVYTWTAADNCGNTAVRTITVNYSDNTAPEFFNVPASVTIECGNDIPGFSTAIYATDNCDADATVTTSEEMVDLTCGYQLIREYVATDNCGNTTAVYQTITIVDTTAPVFNQTVENMNVNCSDIPAVPVITASDVCDSEVQISYTEEIGSGCPYTITRTWTATDDCGNATVLTQVISVTDEVAPVFDYVAPWISLSCDEVAAFLPTATDNCDNDVTVEIIEELLFSGNCMGNLQRTYEATDNCGNTVTAIQIIQVTDNVAPQIFNVPSNTTIYCGNELPALPTDVYATDNCSPEVELFFEQTQTNEFCPYDVIRTWTALDMCGNETVMTQVIHVTVEVPTIASFQTYPNPADGDFTFEFSTPKDAVVYSAIYDMAGKEVMVLMNGNADAGRLYKFTVNGGKLDTGSYTVMLNIDGEIMRSRMIIAGK